MSGCVACDNNWAHRIVPDHIPVTAEDVAARDARMAGYFGHTLMTVGRGHGKSAWMERIMTQIQEARAKRQEIEDTAARWTTATAPAPGIGNVRWPGGQTRNRRTMQDFSGILDDAPAFPTVTADLLDLLIEAKIRERINYPSSQVRVTS